ncbi:pancreatic secretory granule membrane major glycoprotein GP2-like [Aplochiton taeniatus]
MTSAALLLFLLAHSITGEDISGAEEVTLEPASRTSMFRCGHKYCPSGQDCLTVDRSKQCVDPCDHYSVLDDPRRSVTFRKDPDNQLNDRSAKWDGWYRLQLNGVNARMPGTCVSEDMCGTSYPLWLSSTHPRPGEGIIRSNVCGAGKGSCCRYNSNEIHVKGCTGGFYIYKFVAPKMSQAAYCADGEQEGIVWYLVDRKEGSCGNTLKTNGSHAIFSNNIFVYPLAVVPGSLQQPIRIPLSCVYPMDTETSLNVAIKPNLAMQGAGIVSRGSKAPASMFLFHNSNYTEPYPEGRAVLPLGSTLYVGVTVEETETERFAVVLDDCYVTHTPNPEDLMRYHLIENRCPSDLRQVTVDESGSSLQARFSALLFLYQGDYQDIFLHCSLSLCDQRSSSCSPMCFSRRRRSVSQTTPLKPLTIGPITWN